MTGLPGSESDVTVILRCLSVERKGFATRLDRRLVNSDRTKFGTDLESCGQWWLMTCLWSYR